MPDTPVAQVQRQVAKASRRLFMQRLLDYMVWFWAVGLLVAVAWFLVQPVLFGALEEWVRWVIGGSIFAIATAIGIWLTWRQAPSTVETALEFDQRFRLKERATTSLTLTPELLQSPAGQALAADAAQQAGKVNVRIGFPVRLSWTAMLVPVCGVVLALVAVFYDPVFDNSNIAVAREEKVANPMQIEEAQKKLEKALSKDWTKEEKSKELDEIEKMLASLAKQPFDAKEKDKIRQQLQKMVPVEEKMRDRLDDLKAMQDRNKAIQDQLKKMANDPERKPAGEGPGKDLENALNKGDMDAAQKQLADLADKLKDNKLTDEQRRQLQKQLDDIQQQLKNLAKLNELDPDLLKELEEFSGKIGECKDCIGDDPKEGAKKLARLAKDLQEWDLDAKERELLQEQLKALMECKNAMRNGLGLGERPLGPDQDTSAKAERQAGELNNKTQFHITGQQKGGSFNRIPANQIGGEFKQRQQEAADAIERQQVRPEDAPVIRGYFENLGGGQKK